MPNKSRSAKQKGAAAEREVINYLNEKLGTNYKRNLEQTREAQHGDVNGTVGGCSIEIKRREGMALNSWLRQAKNAAGDTLIPAVIFRRNREPWRVVVELTLDEFIEAVKQERFLNLRGE